ncbi:hypothetical protein YC2023_090552 [Brassica napus]
MGSSCCESADVSNLVSCSSFELILSDGKKKEYDKSLKFTNLRVRASVRLNWTYKQNGEMHEKGLESLSKDEVVHTLTAVVYTDAIRITQETNLNIKTISHTISLWNNCSEEIEFRHQKGLEMDVQMETKSIHRLERTGFTLSESYVVSKIELINDCNYICLANFRWIILGLSHPKFYVGMFMIFDYVYINSFCLCVYKLIQSSMLKRESDNYLKKIKRSLDWEWRDESIKERDMWGEAHAPLFSI